MENIFRGDHIRILEFIISRMHRASYTGFTLLVFQILRVRGEKEREAMPSKIGNLVQTLANEVKSIKRMRIFAENISPIRFISPPPLSQLVLFFLS